MLQGDALAPMLFNITPDAVVSSGKVTHGKILNYYNDVFSYIIICVFILDVNP